MSLHASKFPRLVMILIVGWASIPTSLTRAQESDSTKVPNAFARAIKSSRKAYVQQMVPIHWHKAQEDRKFYSQRNANQAIIRRLESPTQDPQEKLRDVRKEKDNLRLRIQQLEMLEDVLTDENPDAIESAIDAAKARIEDLNRRRSEMRENNQHELTELTDRFAKKYSECATILSGIFKEEFKGKFGGARRTLAVWNYLAATATVRYQNNDLRKITISMNFQTDKKKTVSKKDQVMGRFPVRRRSKSTLDFYVDDVSISVSISPPNDRTAEDFDLENFFAMAVDVDKFEQQVKLASDKPLLESQD